MFTKEYYQSFMNEFSPTIIIWEGVDWKPVELNLKKMVHLLFWGQSWSWKSVFVLQLLYQLLFFTNPESLKLILVDPLRVSFKDFKELPHLLAPVANTVQEAIEAINLMIKTSRERYEFLEAVWFENIYDYNEALLKDKIPYKVEGLQKIVSIKEISKEYIEKTKTETYILWKPIPQLVTFIDEFNALMLEEEFWWKTPADANTPVLKDLIAVSEQARKAWIIIILGTQKIDAKTVPTKIRWNLKTKICLKVSSTDASRAILWDAPENRRQWASLSWYWDWLVYNEDLNTTQAIRFQSAFVPHSDMLDIVNGFIIAYWKNTFEYIKVNEEYAKNAEDLEPTPIAYEDFKDWLPNMLIVKDNIFLQPKYQKLLSQLIREPFSWDDKAIKLRYPSIKDFSVIKQQLMDTWILAVNYPEDEEDENTQDEKKKKDKEKEGYLGLNLRLKWLEEVLVKVGFIKNDRGSWDAKYNEKYQSYMMKLCLLHLNKEYNVVAKKLSLDINEYI